MMNPIELYNRQIWEEALKNFKPKKPGEQIKKEDMVMLMKIKEFLPKEEWPKEEEAITSVRFNQLVIKYYTRRMHGGYCK